MPRGCRAGWVVRDSQLLALARSRSCTCVRRRNMQETSKHLEPPTPLEAARFPAQASLNSPKTSTEPPSSETARLGISSSGGHSPNPTRTLLQVIGVTACIIAGVWYYSGLNSDQPSLDEARAKLTSTSDELKVAREAKASLERALAEAQAKLAAEQKLRLAAEKAVADVKAVLASIPSAAEPGGPPKPAESAKGAIPK